MPDFSHTVRAVINTRGWTARQLAEHVGASVRTVEGWLFGRSPSGVAARAVEALAEATETETETESPPA